MVPTLEGTQRERAALDERRQAGAITDPVITPFVRALVREGYRIKADRSGCDLLGTCPGCQSRYLFTALKDGKESVHCPHCHDAHMRSQLAIS